MKQNKSLLLCCLLLIVSSAIKAQIALDYIPQTRILKSDAPSKSVLVSSARIDQIPDASVIGPHH